MVKKKNNLILNKYKREFTIDGLKYKLGLVTPKYVFYYNDEYEQAIMYDLNMKLISDNYFAGEEFSNQLGKLYPTKGWLWANNDAKYNAKQIYEESLDN